MLRHDFPLTNLASSFFRPLSCIVLCLVLYHYLALLCTFVMHYYLIRYIQCIIKMFFSMFFINRNFFTLCICMFQPFHYIISIVYYIAIKQTAKPINCVNYPRPYFILVCFTSALCIMSADFIKQNFQLIITLIGFILNIF